MKIALKTSTSFVAGECCNGDSGEDVNLSPYQFQFLEEAEVLTVAFLLSSVLRKQTDPLDPSERRTY